MPPQHTQSSLLTICLLLCASSITGCIQSTPVCNANTDCYTGEVCTQGVCLVSTAMGDMKTTGDMPKDLGKDSNTDIVDMPRDSPKDTKQDIVEDKDMPKMDVEDMPADTEDMPSKELICPDHEVKCVGSQDVEYCITCPQIGRVIKNCNQNLECVQDINMCRPNYEPCDAGCCLKSDAPFESNFIPPNKDQLQTRSIIRPTLKIDRFNRPHIIFVYERGSKNCSASSSCLTSVGHAYWDETWNFDIVDPNAGLATKQPSLGLFDDELLVSYTTDTHVKWDSRSLNAFMSFNQSPNKILVSAQGTVHDALIPTKISFAKMNGHYLIANGVKDSMDSTKQTLLLRGTDDLLTGDWSITERIRLSQVEDYSFDITSSPAGPGAHIILTHHDEAAEAIHYGETKPMQNISGLFKVPESSSVGVISNPSIDVDKNNKPHAVYVLSDLTNGGRLRYATKRGASTWTLEDGPVVPLVSTAHKIFTDVRIDSETNEVYVLFLSHRDITDMSTAMDQRIWTMNYVKRKVNGMWQNLETFDFPQRNPAIPFFPNCSSDFDNNKKPHVACTFSKDVTDPPFQETFYFTFQ